MLNILSFGASNSSTSINVQLARYATRGLSGVDINFIDINDFEMPIYSIDREKESGIPRQQNSLKSTSDERMVF